MSRRQIVIEIDCEDERCHECSQAEVCAWIDVHQENTPRGLKAVYFRGPLCLAAERKLRALVEAGNAMFREDRNAGQLVRDSNGAAWDRAIAALKVSG